MISLFDWYILTPTILLWCIIFHEVGHILAFRILGKNVDFNLSLKGKKVKIAVGYPLDYALLKRKEKLNIYLLGIVAGTIPFCFITGLTNLHQLIIVAAYLIGCKKDLRNVFNTLQNSKNCKVKGGLSE